MRFFRSLVLCLAALCSGLALPANAQGYQAVNWLTVVPLNPTDFEVIEARGEGARGIWCAAADFAIYRLGFPRDRRIYIKTPRGPSISGTGRIGVVFTIDEASLGTSPKQSYSVTVRTKGLGLPVHHAHQFCRDYFLDLDDLFLRRHRR